MSCSSKPPFTGTSTGVFASSICRLTCTSALGTRNENSRITGVGVGRPPTRPVVPGDIEVPAAANSRANSSIAAFDGDLAAIFSTTSREVGRALAPYMSSAPMISMRVSVKGGRFCSASMRAMRLNSDSPVRRALAAACSPAIVRKAALR